MLIPYLCERFHVGVRASGYGIGFTLAVIVPGLYSFMLIGLGKVIRYEYGVVVLLAIGAVCTVAGAVLGPETKDVDLDTRPRDGLTQPGRRPPGRRGRGVDRPRRSSA
ncbi:hypothetical protein AB0383_04355, partial [Amycolatopsis sp. NPDC051373]